MLIYEQNMQLQLPSHIFFWDLRKAIVGPSAVPLMDRYDHGLFPVLALSQPLS